MLDLELTYLKGAFILQHKAGGFPRAELRHPLI